MGWEEFEERKGGGLDMEVGTRVRRGGLLLPGVEEERVGVGWMGVEGTLLRNWVRRGTRTTRSEIIEVRVSIRRLVFCKSPLGSMKFVPVTCSGTHQFTIPQTRLKYLKLLLHPL